MYFIDSHCHIDRLNYKTIHKNVEDVLLKSNQYCIKKFLTVSTSIKNFYTIQKLLKNYHSIFYSCGIHPLNARKELEKSHDIKSLFEKIHKLSFQSNVIAIGETGLDYYHVNEKKNIQQDLFRQHIKLARKLKKPIIVHSRNAIQDIIKILREEKAEQCQGIIHSFSEDYKSAYKLLDIGFYISFSGMITFKNSFKLHEVVKKIPLNFFLIETDSPFLSPSPYRGKENQPAYLIEIAKKIASLKNLDLEEIAKITTKNFYTLFDVKK